MEFTWKKGYITQFFENQHNLSSITIATAYFSKYGLNLLKKLIKQNDLLKKDVTLYLSTEFNTQLPSSILQELHSNTTTYIVDKVPLHAKVILITNKHDYSYLICGSANFTEGGLQKNLEFMTIHSHHEFDHMKIRIFFDHCKNNSISITPEIISAYKQIETSVSELDEIKNKIKKELRSIYTQTDSFQENTYNLSNQFFKYTDYETLFPRNRYLKSPELRENREQIKKKLLKIHYLLYPYIKRLDLNCHWNEQNITSSTIPSDYTHNRISWMGVRYGKTESEVKELNYNLPKYSHNKTENEHIGFQKHACIQFSLVSTGFEIMLFHAVANDAVDRGYLRDIIADGHQNTIDLIMKEVEKLKGKGFVWHITDVKNKKHIASFNFDTDKSQDFFTFYKKYDENGLESYCSFYISPDDENLLNRKTIAKVVLKKTKQLLPLYKLIAKRFTY
ncbi:phospholipase D family protein [Bacillus cereus]|nr:phospholipase D family protein [Bacillus cereus]HDX9528507.1 phospholipase D family protein [Bacillus thuringiensis]